MFDYYDDQADQFLGFGDETTETIEVAIAKEVKPLNVPLFNLDTNTLDLTTDWHPGDELYEVLRTTTKLKLFVTNLRFEESNFTKLCEAIKLNKSIKIMRVNVATPDNVEKYLPILVKALNKDMKRLEIVLDLESEFNVNDLLVNLKGLRSPTKSFKLIVNDYNHGSENSPQYYQKHIELLKTTNIDKVEWGLLSLFGASKANGSGFKQFSDYLVKSNNIKSLSFDLELQEQPLQEILTKVTSLTHLNFVVVSHEQALQMSKLVQLSESLRKCNLYWFENPTDEATYQGDKNEYKSILQETILRNKKLQNSRVTALITVLFNIAHDTSNILPRDIWTLIMSLITIPGVTLDFGSISQSIFKDNSIRRVIHKRVKKTK